MKKHVLIFLMGIPSCLFAQQVAENQSNALLINALSQDSVRYEVRRNEVLAIKLAIRQKPSNRKWLKALPLAGVPSLIPNKTSGLGEQGKNKRNPNVNLGVLGSISALNVFGRKSARAFIEIKHYASDGTLLRVERPSASGKRGNYKITKPIDQDGYLIVAIRNLEKNNITITSSITNTGPHPPKGGIPGEGGGEPGPEPESDAPIAWENYLDGVTIVGTGTFAENNFMATYEAAFGPSETWIAVGTGTGDGSGSGGGEGGYEPPSAEAKQMARELKKIDANMCEARYVLYHITDVPQMGPILSYTKYKAEEYMDELNMSVANNVGYSKENAFKHAYVSAINYCALGAQHSKAISDLHETCDGVNMNPTVAERTMDMYNNNEGFKIAAAVGCSPDFHEIKSALNTAYHNGTLHDINGNKIY
ncbi:DUF6973 domain-containing protein [Dyadobacter arcticus]|uniref:DUF6973 domain-containing protein n=1 Tax=Dyadobacter arcticus TaxID=1078754 RepID=A0ABX0UJT4_9BACT|nr:hypothetical protein [Dyadobacter arcticus]NIJ51665.1 hypothetical protein [Dyadobacter arcticus]